MLYYIQVIEFLFYIKNVCFNFFTQKFMLERLNCFEKDYTKFQRGGNMISIGYLTTSTKDESLKMYEKDWVGKGLSNPSLTFYTSMVYGFAKHLPYSMDIEQPEYVPADFYNMEPSDVETNSYFKWNDRRTFFKSIPFFFMYSL